MLVKVKVCSTAAEGLWLVAVGCSSNRLCLGCSSGTSVSLCTTFKPKSNAATGSTNSTASSVRACKRWRCARSRRRSLGHNDLNGDDELLGLQEEHTHEMLRKHVSSQSRPRGLPRRTVALTTMTVRNSETWLRDCRQLSQASPLGHLQASCRAMGSTNSSVVSSAVSVFKSTLLELL